MLELCAISLHVPSLTTGTTSNNRPSTHIAVIIAPILVGMVILLVGITLLVIGVILIVKRKRHTPTVQYGEEFAVEIYDDVVHHVKCNEDSDDYEEIDDDMYDTNRYATIK